MKILAKIKLYGGRDEGIEKELEVSPEWNEIQIHNYVWDCMINNVCIDWEEIVEENNLTNQ